MGVSDGMDAFVVRRVEVWRAERRRVWARCREERAAVLMAVRYAVVVPADGRVSDACLMLCWTYDGDSS